MTKKYAYGRPKRQIPPGRGYKGDGDKCPHGCGLTYGKLRTGLRYWDVFVMLMDYSEDSAEWTYKKRATVLGKWHEIKKSMWEYHCEEGGCPEDPRNVAATASNLVLEGDAYEDEVPF